MESVDFKGLYESYRSVYTEEVEEIDEANRAEREFKLSEPEKLAARNTSSEYFRVSSKDPSGPMRFRAKGKLHADSQEKRRERHATKRGVKESPEYDLYDLVLEYLLDEGLCESVENAEIMMAHMSESWVESIIDEAATIMAVKSPKGEDRKVSKLRSGQETSQQIQKRAFSQMLSDRQKERQNRMNSGRATVARKRGIEKATNRSERLHDFVPGEAHYRIEDDGTIPTDYRARRRRASGR
jgi:hypothetical protein